MNYLNILSFSTSDFTGISVVIAVAGCTHKCDGCWAKDRGGWKFNSGIEFTKETTEYILDLTSKGYIDNLVIQGGDPLHHRNFEEVKNLANSFKNLYPEKRVVIFTGYTYEEIEKDLTKKGVLKIIDVLVDGKYDKTKPEGVFCGSNNQRILWLDSSGKVYKEGL